MRVRRLRGIAAAAVATTALVTACGGGNGSAGGDGKVQLALVAYSTPQAAYKDIIAAFQKTPEGKNITFTQSFGASGDQSRAVASGLKADIVEFSLETDITRLVKAGLVAPDWNSGPTQGILTKSVVVIGTRKGNPKNIKTWDDLVKPGVEVITPNPFTSGGARWNLLAGWGAKSNKGADEAAGLSWLDALLKNVPVQDDSGRKSLQTFTGGKGDAILTYENEAIFAQQNHQEIDYTVPDSTILIENPVAVTKNSAHPKEAAAFLKYLYSTEAQTIFAKNGYRPVVDGISGFDFPTPPQLFTIRDLGGWDAVTKNLFDPTGKVADIERKLGVATEK
ncbi:sulfate ABC transporter substrate-binding protein [Microbispora corallina]|uniref:Sulfate ABC transporter, sulfate-binding protein SubI n=1 Tax=Microbispora corallina TaxID=83302 RepID=A0ABQ4G9I6_9ACTN|nr:MULTISPECIES: sulfate ABC transporter substrate-binding protein [Microbispora]ETK35140.1 sulfate ABC transporter substrate-binding protein [Microbispora sp. ATCC PTA-5024]GIH43687.1 putative sulfate ABC transporter, sulfate-binding protein SubI [Microbispora corallina]